MFWACIMCLLRMVTFKIWQGTHVFNKFVILEEPNTEAWIKE